METEQMDEQDQIMELDSEMLAALAIAELAEKYPAESDPAEMTLSQKQTLASFLRAHGDI